MADIVGFKELSRQLDKLGDAVQAGKTLRRAALSSMLPALRAAQVAAPVGDPPYESGDPYPVTSYTGRLRTPGFAKRNVARKAYVDNNGVVVLLGVKPEAFYAVQFIELGTSKIPKRPWLRPSFRASIGAVDSRLRARLRDLLQKAVRR